MYIMNIGHQTIMFMPHATLSISNSLHNQCMNLFNLPEKYRISILDGGEDTCVLVKGWEVFSVHNIRRANVVGFDHVIMRLQ
jgi:phosphoserine aminotransferase